MTYREVALIGVSEFMSAELLAYFNRFNSESDWMPLDPWKLISRLITDSENTTQTCNVDRERISISFYVDLFSMLY